MVKSEYKVVWSKIARIQFHEIFIHIRRDSYDSALVVSQKIIEITEGLRKMPRRYNADKQRLDRNPDFRALEIYKIRISFHIEEEEKTVTIVRLRSTRKKPFLY